MGNEKRAAYQRSYAARRRATRTPEEKETARQYQKAWQEKNKERLQAYQKARYEEDRDLLRDQRLRAQYGISAADYDVMLAQQGNCCGICRRPETEFPRRLAVDHDHKTGAVRGLLCSDCNTGLGKLRDGELFASATAYLNNCN